MKEILPAIFIVAPFSLALFGLLGIGANCLIEEVTGINLLKRIINKLIKEDEK